ncbi:2-C-methyl-D-erythritol 4-phosphate cytidylyltransferase [Prevotellaceae bacterium MN60]|nr:2-C-methyl-D-erythritol 4-phosphate cytidylyltransferase [Prevotellaceae bacterium MN60]
MDYIIIVAGGKGLRMGGDIPKQFLPIGGKPVLMRTIERFRAYSNNLQIILVLPEAQQDYWKQLCKEYAFDVDYMLTNGGETRFHSVQHGLALIPDDAQGVVGVHDGVRPFPSIEVIKNCYETAREKKAVIPVVPVVETLRHITDGTKPRNEYRLVQTPQCFDIQLLKAANRQPYNEGFTDDASVVEAFGFENTLVEGNRENIKITTPYDIVVAEAIINYQQH